jgi:hypothetical protein
MCAFVEHTGMTLFEARIAARQRLVALSVLAERFP